MAKTLIERAIAQLETRIRETEPVAFNASSDVRNFARLKLAVSEREIFAALFLDAQHRLISYQELFYGSVAECSVYPREVAKAALACNAAAVIFAHNHPSGVAEPSTSDIRITERLRNALQLFDIRVLDHIVVSLSATVSMAERGQI